MYAYVCSKLAYKVGKIRKQMKLNQYFGLRDDISNCVQNQILICKCLYVFHHLKLSHRYILFDIFHLHRSKLGVVKLS